MKKFIFGFLLIIPLKAHAIVIEGFTPNGTFKTVGLDNSGALQVNLASGTFTLAKGSTVTANQGTFPWAISGMVQASTAATVLSGQVNLSPGVPSVLIAANPNAAGTTITNQDNFSYLFVGPPGVSLTTGIRLLPGQSYSPDMPSTFTGELVGISSAGITVGFIQLQP